MAVWLYLALLAAALAVVACAPRSPLRIWSSIGRVRRGRVEAMLRDLPAVDPLLVGELRSALASAAAEERRSGATSDKATGGSNHHGSGNRQALLDAAVPGVLAGLVGLDNWLHPDPQVLEAVQQATHEHVANTLDLWHAVGEHHYHLWTVSSLINWRGHVGEQVVFDHLHAWLGDRVQLEPLSNHPGSDLTIDGHDFNVKVTADYHNVAADHFATYPDTPIIINADAAHLPSDALHVDLSAPFNPDMLDGHAVVVADGLSLSGIQDSLGDSFGDVIGGHLDLADVVGGLQEAGIPVLGSAIRVVRSGIRENRLRGVHGDSGRMVKNIATDVTVVGGSVAAGVTAGHIVGGAIDVFTLGATGGLGTLFGGMLGGALGGLFGNKAATDIRLEPFRDAQAEARTALAHYNDRLDAVTARSQRRWEAIVAESTQRCAEQERRLQAAADEAAARARADLQADNLIGTRAARGELDQASEKVNRAVARERSVLAKRRAQRWKAAATAASSPVEMFDAVLAAPDGRHAVADLLSRVRQQREAALVALVEAGRATAAQARRTRAAETRFLADAKTALHDDALRKMRKPLKRVDAANQNVLAEARAAGIAT